MFMNIYRDLWLLNANYQILKQIQWIINITQKREKHLSLNNKVTPLTSRKLN